MALNIRNPETEELAAKLAKLTGETKTEAVRKAVEQRLERLERERAGRSLVDDLREIARSYARLPLLDDRSEEEILGYGPDGLPEQ